MLLGMGRTPVREALRRLQNEGMIVCNSTHNYRVRILTAADIKEIYETLGILEGAAAGAVPQIITSEDLGRFVKYNNRMRRVAEEGDLAELGHWNHEFHGIFLKRYGNRMLHEGVRLQIQWELFDAWNHPNFGNGNTNITSGNFGHVSYDGGGRSMWFGGRIDFKRARIIRLDTANHLQLCPFKERGPRLVQEAEPSVGAPF